MDESSTTKKPKTVNEKALIVTIDIGKSIHPGYFRGPDGQDIKPFPFNNSQQSYEFWMKILQFRENKHLDEVVVGFESTGPYAEPLMNFFVKKPVRLVQVRSAFGEVPTKVLILRFCLMVLKKISICHRSLYIAAIAVASEVMWLNRRTMTLSFCSSQTSIRRRGPGYF